MKTHLKTITVSYSFVLACTTEQDPEQVARNYLRESLADMGERSEDITIRVTPYATCKPSGWTGDCIPYGGDGNTATETYEANNE